MDLENILTSSVKKCYKYSEPFIKKYWWLAALIFIFWFSYHIRAINNIPDKLLSFDPIYQYRFTYYLANWGHLPVWDELSYYVGRAVIPVQQAPLMWYVTTIFYWIFSLFGLSLKTTAATAGALYGAAIVIPAFLLGRELSNKYGGLLAATLTGTAPQILVRTFGSSYDTDQIVIFFILLTIYLGIYALRKRTVGAFSLALIGFSMFMLSWGLFWYTFFIIAGSAFLYLILGTSLGERKWKKEGKKPNLTERFSLSVTHFKFQLIILVSLFLGITLLGFIFQSNPIDALLGLFGFAFRTEAWIVNISIAELQPINLSSIETWATAMGKFTVGDNLIDSLIFITFVALIIFGLLGTYKRNIFNKSVLITLFLLGFYTISKGIRFTEFSSGIFIILIAAGYGYLVDYCKRDKFLKSFSIGLGVILAILAFSLALQFSQYLGPDISSNWDSAWNFLKEKTPELSLVGTWWDPGHMVTGLADRRVIADGAHCGNDCMYTINDRITDLGKIFASDNENTSLQLLRKYQGTSPKIYWIASSDLIGKFQWLQYFGTGCDARSEQRCPLYYQINLQSASYTTSGEIGARFYGNVILLSGFVPFPVLTQGKNAYIIDEWFFYAGSGVKSLKAADYNRTQLINQLSPILKQLDYTLSNRTVGELGYAYTTIWIERDYSYVVLIPVNLRDNVFTKQFFLEGEGLDHFKQVFRNEEVKIYEVV